MLHYGLMGSPTSATSGTGMPSIRPLCLIDASGKSSQPEDAGGLELPDAETLLSIYSRMVIARRFDTQANALARQGRLATYPSAQGQEACEIACVSALAETDWLFPTYRDSMALLTRGITASEILSYFRGDWHCGYDPYQHRVAPQATPLATQALHAVGLATAARLKNDDVVALTFLGDGSTSEGDAHEAFNLAAVWQAPVVFVIQNNQFAISVPVAQQSHARTFADRAIGYGMPGYYVDGNDAAAMYAVTAAAIARARSGGGPSMIEGLTYRMEAHTNSDDPGRYRSADDTAEWKTRDPILRLETWLRVNGALSDAEHTRVAAEAEDLAAASRAAMSTQLTPDPQEMFRHVYGAERPTLVEQAEFLARELESVEEGVSR